MSIAVTGSVAFDHIMTFPGYFKDHILPDKVHILSVSFLVDSLAKRRGGTAANIAYNLGLLGEPSRIVATVGEDFGPYRETLEKAGVDTSGLKEIAGESTASGFITTDLADNQITGFYIGAMGRAGDFSLKEERPTPSMVIIAANDPRAMERYPAESREMRVPFVYDPGQQIVRLEKDQLLDGMRGARCVIGNDYEIAMITQKTGIAQEQILDLAEMLVITMGDRGSVVYERTGAVTEIPAAKARTLVDPTGAGDAYRAGLLRGLVRGEAPRVWGPVAALVASYAVERQGTQEHTFTEAEFARRLKEAF